MTRALHLLAFGILAVLAWQASGHAPAHDRAPRPIVSSPAVARTRPMLTRSFVIPVLMYHRICELTPREARSPLARDLTVSPDAFDWQMQYLVHHGYTLLLARDVEAALREGLPLPRKAVAVTMDDGYHDNFDRAFPILQRYHLPATLFLVTGTVGTPRHVSWDEARIMHGAGLGVGSHTVHHWDLTLLPLTVLDVELRESRRALEEQLVDRVTAVAYPSGKYNAQVAARAQAAGYLAGWKKGGGPVRPGDDLYLLPRIRVRGCTSMTDFQAKVKGSATESASPRRCAVDRPPA